MLSQVPSTAASPREVVFVDSTLPNWQDLLTHISPDAKVVVLDPLKNGIVQMAEALQNETGMQAVHLLSHGGSGFVVVGNTMLSSYNLDNYIPQLAVIRAALSDQADFLLYGCDVAQGEAGAHFVQQLALATGADVAASSDDTGVSGDWVLEVQSGAVEAQGIEATDYTADLATIVVTNLNDTGAGSLRAAIASANNTSADTIVFDPALFASGAQTLTLTTGELNVDGNANTADALTIIGPGENLLTISGNNSSRIFNANGTLPNSSPLTLSGMTITAGKAITTTSGYGGGAIHSYRSGSLTLDHIRIQNSTSSYVGGGLRFYDNSTVQLKISNSTISGNSSTGIHQVGKGGGLYVSLYDASASVVISNSTISGNSSAQGSYGGGGFIATKGGITITNTTIANNSISSGSGTGDVGGGGLLLGGRPPPLPSPTPPSSAIPSPAEGGTLMMEVEVCAS